MDEKVGWSQKKAECAEGERKLRQTGRRGNEPRFGGRSRGPFFEDEEGCERNDLQSADEREGEETEMGICQVLASLRVKGESGTEKSLS